MASLSSLPWILANNSSRITSPFSGSKSHSSTPRNPRYGVHYFPCRTSASASNGDQTTNSNSNSDGTTGDAFNKFDRRNVLFGLGGLYGAAALGGDTSALASPVITPNISNCGPSIILVPGSDPPKEVGRINCCPPSPDEIYDFIPTPSTGKYRERKPAHKYTTKDRAKLEEAVRRMKQLDPSDPRSFYQQANIHCAYCNVGYEQQGFPGIDLQVHSNWLFFPFHRCYLYFLERILGSLINDPTFALPYWNWDHPDGMYMPAIYDYGNTNSPLYNTRRNQNHRPPKLLDLNYSGDDNITYDVVDSNLRLMHRQMITNAKTAEQFFGKPIRGGEVVEGGEGSIESNPHNNIHLWGGDTRTPYGEDLGNFYSAGRDMLFYGLHANVDRMWVLWKQLGQGKNKDFTEDDYLESSFVLYDENGNAVRMKVIDCLDTRKLGYTYGYSPVLWTDTKPIPFKQKQPKTLAEKSLSPKVSVPAVTFPLVLNSVTTIVVERPKKSRKRDEKEKEDEVLVIQGIQYDQSLNVHVDVLVNVSAGDEKNISPGNSEFAGSFSNVPHLHKHDRKTSVSFALTELLEELDCDDDDTVTVTLVPVLGIGKVTISGIKIKFLPLN